MSKQESERLGERIETGHCTRKRAVEAGDRNQHPATHTRARGRRPDLAAMVDGAGDAAILPVLTAHLVGKEVDPVHQLALGQAVFREFQVKLLSLDLPGEECER